METREIRPSTLVGVKRLASQLGKEGGFKHTQALEIASRAAGCENYRHALRILPSAPPRALRYVLVTVYWIDSKTHGYGRETLRVELGKPLSDLCSKAELKQIRGFGHDVRLVADDHIVHDRFMPSQDSARRIACMGARSLQFMEHTGLRPCQRPPLDLANGEGKLPGADHATDWTDPTTGQYIFVDEPYGGDEVKRRFWAEHHHWQIARSSWAGMYFPRHADLWLASPDNDKYNLVDRI